MKKFSKLFFVILLVLSLSLLSSCKDKNTNKTENPFGDGVEGPMVDVLPNG